MKKPQKMEIYQGEVGDNRNNVRNFVGIENQTKSFTRWFLLTILVVESIIMHITIFFFYNIHISNGEY